MAGSWALWAAETGQGAEAVRIARKVEPARPIAPWLATMRATVAASVHDTDAALESLRDADRALAVDPEPPWSFIAPFSPVKLAGYTGRAYVTLGLHKAAVPVLRDALSGTPRCKQRALLLLDLARALGDGDESAEARTEARQIGDELDSRKVLTGA
jgi:hypothetical protein